MIAALAANPGDIFDYLEAIGKAQKLANPSMPYIASRRRRVRAQKRRAMRSSPRWSTK
ncbi:hypothetical protein [Candidatus Flexifilum breve]|uniref:hypothetical protein n=1 Tax=Candidatus Flexifilum breve TaxID=3140694 RepID=UPI0031CCCB9F